MAIDIGSLFSGLGAGLTSYGVEKQKAEEIARQEEERKRQQRIAQQKAALEYAMSGLRSIPNTQTETPAGMVRAPAPYFDDVDLLIDETMTPTGRIGQRRQVFKDLYPGDPRMTTGVIEGLAREYIDLNDVLPNPSYDPRRGGTARVTGGGTSPNSRQAFVKNVADQYVDANRGMAGMAWNALKADPERYQLFISNGGTIADFQASANRPTRYATPPQQSIAEIMANLPPDNGNP
jgi:hypothetical protein